MSMAKVTLKGNEVNTNSEIVKAGESAPDFILVDSDLNDVNLASYEGKNKILSIVPSFCLLYTSPSPRDCDRSRMPSSA